MNKEIREQILSKFIDKDSKFEASKVLDAFVMSKKTGCQSVTNFLTPVFLSEILQEIERNLLEYQTSTFGGYDSAERRCIVFNEDEYNYFDVDILKITTNRKFNKALEHRAVLGSILGLGINRSKVGDIVFKDEECFVFVKNEITDFILFNLEYVGRSKVKVESVVLESFKNEEEQKLKTTTVSSLRVDTIISNVTNYSRSEVKKLFEKNLILINWRVCNNTSTPVKEGDIITVRKFGRIKLEHIRGFSKKGKHIIDYY